MAKCDRPVRDRRQFDIINKTFADGAAKVERETTRGATLSILVVNVLKTFEPRHEKTNILVSDQV